MLNKSLSNRLARHFESLTPIYTYYHDVARELEAQRASEREQSHAGLIAMWATLVIIIFANWSGLCR
jgi:hypothetical protein